MTSHSSHAGGADHPASHHSHAATQASAEGTAERADVERFERRLAGAACKPVGVVAFVIGAGLAVATLAQAGNASLGAFWLWSLPAALLAAYGLALAMGDAKPAS